MPLWWPAIVPRQADGLEGAGWVRSQPIGSSTDVTASRKFFLIWGIP